MKKIDQFRKTRYQITMKIIQLESKRELNSKEKDELQVLKKKESDLDEKINKAQKK